MLSTILLAAQGHNQANRPVRLISADVVSPAPDLKIRLENDDRNILEGSHFIIPKSLSTYTATVLIDGMQRNCTFNNELQAGDELIVMSVQGLEASKYFILDKVEQWE